VRHAAITRRKSRVLQLDFGVEVNTCNFMVFLHPKCYFEQFETIAPNTPLSPMILYNIKHTCKSSATRCKYFATSYSCQFPPKMLMNEWNANMTFYSSIDE
jgi:hypothetical protein